MFDGQDGTVMSNGESVGLLSSPHLAQVPSGTAQDPVKEVSDAKVVSYGALEEAAETCKGVSRDQRVGEESALFQKQHHRDFSRESGFETDRTQWSRSCSCSSCEELEELEEVASRESQEAKLFLYMEAHTARVEQELSRISLAALGQAQEEGCEGTLDVTSTVVSINQAEVDGFDIISIHSEFVSVEEERNRCKSAFGLLCNLKYEIIRLKGYFESQCARLDRFVMEGEGSSEGGQRLLGENSMQVEAFGRRLDTCMDGVGRQMEEIRSKNDIILNGVRLPQNRRYSESTINKLIRKSPVNCVTWFHGLLFLVLLGLLSYLYMWSGSSPQWTICLRLVRSPLLVVLLLYLYGINMKVWALYKVDYATIFGHHPSSTPTPKYIFKVASVLTVLMTVLVIGLVVATPFAPKLPLKIIPLTMWLVLFAFLLNPCDIFLQKGRFNLLLTFTRVLIAPLAFVYFSDFFLADQFNSTVGIFLDMEYLVCYLTTDAWSGENLDTTVCTWSGNGIRPLLSLIPSFWRIMQCLRCYYDTRNIKHLVNAGKYSSTVPVIVFATLFSTRVKGDIELQFRVRESLWIVICLLVSSFVHAVYTFMWDVGCDWGLWNFKCTVFSRKLVYRRKAVYVLAVVVDFVLRFLWTLKLTLAIVWEKDSDLIYTGKGFWVA